MHDLVGVAAQQELAGRLQAGQHQGQLHGGEVLHLVDDDEVVGGLRQRPPLVGDQVQVEQAGLGQPLPVAAEQGMRRFARGRRQQALALAERQVVGQAQRPGGLRADDAAELLEQGMGIEVAERLGGGAMAVEPAAERR